MLMQSAMPFIPSQIQGCKVFPCMPEGKLPATPNGWKDAVSAPGQLSAWHLANPHFNWAVAAGLSGLFVIDVDPAGLAWWTELMARDDAVRSAVEATFQVRTPRGGLHIYFRGAGPSTAGRIATGIDTRGGFWRNGQMMSGGYVLLPGSRTGNGVYEVIHSRPITDLPDCVRALIPERAEVSVHGLERNPDLDQPRNVAWAVELLTKYVADGRISQQGKGGNDLAFRVAASILDKAISPATCYDLLQEHWNGHCEPPWDDWELEAIVRNAAAYGEDAKTGAKGFQSNEDAFASFVSTPTLEQVEKPVERKRLVWLMDDYAAQATDPTWLLPGFLPSEGVGMLYGTEGSYKTFLALDMASCLAHGIPGQWGGPPVQHDVLYMAGEQPKAMSRIRRPAWVEWMEQQGKSNRLHVVDHVPFYHDTEAWTALKLELGELNIRPSLIIIDTLSRFMTGLDENNAKEAIMALDFLEKLARYYECFVLILHHTGKDVNKGARGSSVFHTNTDVMMLARKQANGTALYIKKQKEIDQPDKPYLFQVKEIAASIVLERVEVLADVPKAGTAKHHWTEPVFVKAVLERLGHTSLALLAQEISGRIGVDHVTVRKKLVRSVELQEFRLDGEKWGIPEPEAEYDL